MSTLRRFYKVREIILSSPPVIHQDLWLLILFWLVASLPWILGIHFIPYDSFTEFYPQSRFVVDSIRQGDWPWWNPYQYSGLPVFGDPQGMIFSLHTLVGVVLGPNYTLQVFDIVTLFYLLMGGGAIYAIGYSRGVPRAWLLAAAMVFMLGGVATSRLQHMTQIMTYGWLPILLWLILRIGATQKAWAAILLGALAAFWAANANQVVFLGGIFLVSVALYLSANSHNGPRLLAMYFLAAILAFILLLPMYSAMLEIIGLSDRAKLTVANSTASSFTPLVFTSLLLPALFGNLGGPIWSQTDLTQDFFYIGIIPLALYGLALASPIPWRKPLVLSWLAALLFFTVFSMGVHTPLYPFLFNHIPGFDLFRRPADAAYLIIFLLALGLLVLGREAARSNAPPPSHAVEPDLNRGKYIVVALALGLPFLAFALGGEANSKGAMVALHASYGGLVIRLALLALLLISLNKIFGKSEGIFPTALLVVCGLFWSVDVGLAGRYFGLFSPPYANVALAQRYLDTISPRADSLDGWLRSHTLPSARVEVIGGHESLGHSSMAQWHHAQGYNPIRLSHYSDRIGAFLTVHEPRVFPEDSDGPLDPRYNVLGLRYVAFPTWLLDPVRHTSPVAVEARHYRDALAAHDGQRIFSAEGYEIWSRPGQSLWLAIAHSASLADLKPAPCKLEEFRNIRLELSCDMENAGTLVLGEVHAPGWLACLNEHPAAVTPFFDVFRSVDLPAGRSTLVMTYRPVPFLRHPRC